MNLGKCTKCAKSVYDIEGLTAGPPGKTLVYHKGCFKCDTCGWQLTLTSYKFWEGKPYCKNHYPVTGFGDPNAKHVSGTVGTDAAHIAPQINAPKLDTVQSNVIGPSDLKPTSTVDDMRIKNAMNAPKTETYNQTVRSKFCSNCNKQLPPSGKFCAECGSAV